MLKAVMRACLAFGKENYTIAQVIEAIGMDRRDVKNRLGTLENAGFIVRINSRWSPREGGRPLKEIWYVNTDLFAEHMNRRVKALDAPKNTWDKMWQIARALRRFTLNDLAVICAQTIANTRSFATRYRRLGYLRCLGKAGMKRPLWTFVKDPGPMRPLRRKADVD